MFYVSLCTKVTNKKPSRLKMHIMILILYDNHLLRINKNVLLLSSVYPYCLVPQKLFIHLLI